MPISGIVIRLVDAAGVQPLRDTMSQLRGVELGAASERALAAVIDGRDYEEHDALLAAVRGHEGVCAVDIVFHDFSDVSEFSALPRRQRRID